MQQHSLYLHIPFCRHRCAYCDFNTYAGLGHLVKEYCNALRREIALLGESWRAHVSLAGLETGEPLPERLPLHTVFFGGGTPSLLPAEEIKSILAQIALDFELVDLPEITLEANPGTVSQASLHQLRLAGINRLSLGVQSANPQELRLLEREHDYFDVIRAVWQARRAGFDNINLDLIFGLPEQTLESWERSLDLVLDLQPEHFSLYALTLEHGTPMAHWAGRGLMPEPDPDLAADMYELADRRLAQAGYQQYEISNWARRHPQRGPMVCRHNLQYWRGLPYLGLGAGAHGFAAGRRTANVLAPSAYIQRCQEGGAQPFPRTPATVSSEQTDRRTEMGITMMMGLRLTEQGVPSSEFRRRFDSDLRQVYGAQIERLQRLGLLEWAQNGGEVLRLTPAGRLLGNQVFMQFLDD